MDILWGIILFQTIKYIHSELKIGQSSNSLYCLATDKEVESGLAVIPYTNYTKEDFNGFQIKFDIPDQWSKKRSFHYDFGVVLDKKWEEFKVDDITYRYQFKNISNFFIPFSVLSDEEFFITLCQDQKEQCFWIGFEYCEKKRSFFQKCIRSNCTYTPVVCEKMENIYNGSVLSKHEWKHFNLRKTNNTIEVFSAELGVILNYTDTTDSVYNITRFYATVTNGGFFKIHEYESIVTNKSSSIRFDKIQNSNNSDSLCISMFVYMCATCNISVVLDGTKDGSTIIKEENYTNLADPTWMQIKFEANIGLFQEYNRRVDINTYSDNDQDAFWSIRDIRYCSDQEKRNITINNPTEGQFTCTALLSNKTVKNQPFEFSIINIGNDFVEVNITRNEDYIIDESVILNNFEIQFKSEFNELWTEQKINIGKNKIGNLLPSTKYNIRLQRKEDDKEVNNKTITTTCKGPFMKFRSTKTFNASYAIEVKNGKCDRDNSSYFNATNNECSTINGTLNTYEQCITDIQLDSINTLLSIAVSDLQVLSNKSHIFVVISNSTQKMKEEISPNLRQMCNIPDTVLAWVAFYEKLNSSSNKHFNITIGNEKQIKNGRRSFIHYILINTGHITLLPNVEYKICLVVESMFNRTTSYEANTFNVPSTESNTSNAYFALILLIFLVPLVLFFIYRFIKKSKTVNVTANAEPDLVAKVVFTQLENEPKTGKAKFKLPIVEEGFEQFSKKVAVNELEIYIKESLKTKEFERQHNTFPRGLTKPCTIGSKEENKSRNRYNNIVAYDQNRIILKNMPDCDYINASYIEGCHSKKDYIATQGPKKATLYDFWRMIWQEGVENIIMLANIIEEGKKKCAKYWPEVNENVEYNEFSVCILSTEVFSDFQITKLSVTYQGEKRKVQHIHFTSWPDSGIPLYSHTLVPILQKLQSLALGSAPIIVHCSAGVGRTGTIILLDICIRTALEKNWVDLFWNLYKLRDQRPNMVDNVDQYTLAHMVLFDYFFAPKSSITCDNNFEENIQKICQTDLETHYDFLDKASWADEVMKTMVIEECTDFNVPSKNRFQDIIPDSYGRVKLSKTSEDELSSYINAVFVDGFRAANKFIVTQQPLKDTLSDFWMMVYEQKTCLIVSLTEICIDDETIEIFWPTDSRSILNIGESITLKYISTKTSSEFDIITIELIINEEEESRDIQLICFKNWLHDMTTPEKNDDLIALNEEITRVSKQIKEPVVITCYDGAKASGLLLATAYIVEKIKFENVCDVTLAVRVVRRNRKEFINDKKQFLYLHELAHKFVNGFEIYTSVDVSSPGNHYSFI